MEPLALRAPPALSVCVTLRGGLPHLCDV